MKISLKTHRQDSSAQDRFSSYIKKGRSFSSKLSSHHRNLPVRRFRGEAEIESLLGIPYTTVYKHEVDKKLPVKSERDPANNRRLGYTLEQINILQDHYGTSPRRTSEDKCVTLAWFNQKGGCYKSTTASAQASDYANRGYRVCLVDLDPQASLTQNLGFLPNVEIQREHTLYPYIVDPLKNPASGAKSVILDTHNCNLKFIPSCLQMGYCDMSLSMGMGRASAEPDEAVRRVARLDHFCRLRKIIDAISDDFDIVILDGTPSLGLFPTNIVLSADILCIPVPTESTDYAATIGFSEIFLAEINNVARDLGVDIADQLFPEEMFIPTRYSQSKMQAIGSEEMLNVIRGTFGDRCSDSFIMKHEAMVSNTSLIRRNVFDVNSGVIKDTILGDLSLKRGPHKKATENYESVFDELLREIKGHWPSKLKNLHAEIEALNRYCKESDNVKQD